MPTRHVKEKKKKKKDSPHPKEIKEREMVHEKEFIHHPPKKKKKYISPHTCNTSKASMPLYSYPKLHISPVK